MENQEIEQKVYEGASTITNPNARGGPGDEYAKVTLVEIGDAVKSIKGKITLPATRPANFKDGFVNFYVGLDCLEAGISTVAWKDKWHWFCNEKDVKATNGDNGAFTQYAYGKILDLEIKIDGTAIRYYVEGTEVAKGTYKGNNKNARFIFGAGVNIGKDGLNLVDKLKADTANSASILGTFPSFHNQAIFHSMSYVMTDGTTKLVNSGNAKVTVRSVKWPIFNNVELKCNNPQYHTVSKTEFSAAAGGKIYGSVK